MYTKVPNGLIEAMAKTKHKAPFVVCLAVCRQTLGYQRLWDRISIAQFIQLTGMSNRSIIDAIETAVADGWMIRKRDGDSYQYKINGAEEILNSELSSHKKIAKTEDSAISLCEDSSLDDVNSVHRGCELSSHTKEIYTPSNDGVAAQPTLSLSQQFHALVEDLKATKNRAAKLVEIYVLLYGKEGAPAFGYMMKIANQIGGAGYMAHRLWELAARPPNGDIMAYLLAEHKAKNIRLSAAQRNGNHGGDPGIWHKLEETQPDYMKETTDDD